MSVYPFVHIKTLKINFYVLSIRSSVFYFTVNTLVGHPVYRTVRSVLAFPLTSTKLLGLQTWNFAWLMTDTGTVLKRGWWCHDNAITKVNFFNLHFLTEKSGFVAHTKTSTQIINLQKISFSITLDCRFSFLDFHKKMMTIDTRQKFFSEGLTSCFW